MAGRSSPQGPPNDALAVVIGTVAYIAFRGLAPSVADRRPGAARPGLEAGHGQDIRP